MLGWPQCRWALQTRWSACSRGEFRHRQHQPRKRTELASTAKPVAASGAGNLRRGSVVLEGWSRSFLGRDFFLRGVRGDASPRRRLSRARLFLPSLVVEPLFGPWIAGRPLHRGAVRRALRRGARETQREASVDTAVPASRRSLTGQLPFRRMPCECPRHSAGARGA